MHSSSDCTWKNASFSLLSFLPLSVSVGVFLGLRHTKTFLCAWISQNMNHPGLKITFKFHSLWESPEICRPFIVVFGKKTRTGHDSDYHSRKWWCWSTGKFFFNQGEYFSLMFHNPQVSLPMNRSFQPQTMKCLRTSTCSDVLRLPKEKTLFRLYKDGYYRQVAVHISLLKGTDSISLSAHKMPQLEK